MKSVRHIYDYEYKTCSPLFRNNSQRGIMNKISKNINLVFCLILLSHSFSFTLPPLFGQENLENVNKGTAIGGDAGDINITDLDGALLPQSGSGDKIHASGDAILGEWCLDGDQDVCHKYLRVGANKYKSIRIDVPPDSPAFRVHHELTYLGNSKYSGQQLQPEDSPQVIEIDVKLNVDFFSLFSHYSGWTYTYLRKIIKEPSPVPVPTNSGTKITASSISLNSLSVNLIFRSGSSIFSFEAGT